MKFSVGYQLRQDNSLITAITENRDRIGEVYFAWQGVPNGRNSRNLNSDLNEFEYWKLQEKQLNEISQLGIPLNLLLNAACYGKNSQSRQFFNNLGDTVEYLSEKFNLKSITTTSPLIAKFFKQNFMGIHVRASVNMEIGTTIGMDYLAEYFDSFYLKRDLNRDFSAIKKIRQWCDKNNKKLYGLANSGCLNYCSSHIFHDNLVAHEDEISQIDNAYEFEGQCRIYLKSEEKRKQWLNITNFIRPEDVVFYEGLFDGIKLATRVNKNPRRIIDAYAKESFSGNLPELLEPDHSVLFYPYVVENKKIPDDFATVVGNCNKNCENCGYCEKVLQNSLVALENNL